VDLQSFLGDPDAPVRPYVTLGVALSYNTYRDEQIELDGYRSYYDHGTSGLAFVGGVGLAFGPVELSGVYNLNRFETDGLPAANDADQWDWDHVTVRAGVSLGRF
jgi:hypothetical protein